MRKSRKAVVNENREDLLAAAQEHIVPITPDELDALADRAMHDTTPRADLLRQNDLLKREILWLRLQLLKCRRKAKRRL